MARDEKKIHSWQIRISLFKLFPFACSKGAFKGLHQLGVRWASFLGHPLGRWEEEHLSAAGQGLRPYSRRSKTHLQKSCPGDWAVGAPVVGRTCSYPEHVVLPFPIAFDVSRKHTHTKKNGREAEAREIVAFIHIFECLRSDTIFSQASPTWDATELCQRLEIPFLH